VTLIIKKKNPIPNDFIADSSKQIYDPKSQGGWQQTLWNIEIK
jgi:hypothetical protein